MTMYNQQQIMQRAWTVYNNRIAKERQSFSLAVAKQRVNFADCLTYAWSVARMDIKKATRQAKIDACPIMATIASKIFIIKMHDHMTARDFNDVRVLESELTRLLDE